MEKLEVFIEQALAQLKEPIKISYGLDRGYELTRYRGKWEIQAAGLKEAAHALSSFEKGKELFYGKNNPTCSERILWVEASHRLPLEDGLSIGMPAALHQASTEAIERFAARIIALGYETVLFGQIAGGHLKSDLFSGDLNEIIEILRSYGLRVILSPMQDKETSLEKLKPFKINTIPCDAIFWESLVAKKKQTYQREKTQYELLLQELSLLEDTLDKPLYFYLHPSTSSMAWSHKTWIKDLLNDVGPNTSIAFSAQSGNVCDLTQAQHPIWAQVGRSHTPLLPVLNIGNLGFGEGLWPGVPTDLWFKSRLCTGSIALTPSIPNEGAHLDTLLWVHARLQWEGGYAWDLLRACLPNVSAEHFEWMEQCQRLAIGVQKLLREFSEEEKERLRLEAESLLAQLNLLETEEMETLKYFIRDAKRLVFYALQSHQLTLPNVLNGNDLNPSFWTHMSELPSKGISSGARVDLYSTPHVVESDALMAKLYHENRGEFKG